MGAGLVSSVWGALIGIAVVPLYLKYLGLEAYGLIGFLLTTQALFQILDMGVAPTVNREMARNVANNNLHEMRNLLKTLAFVYWCLAGIICVVMVAIASQISNRWLHSQTLAHESVTRSVMFMGLVIACRWPIGLYQSALIGLQQIGLTSSINIIMVTLSSLGGVCILAVVSPTVEALFLWQAAIGLISAIVLRWNVWRRIEGGGGVKIDFRTLRLIWRFSATMMALTFSGLVFSQLDKVILSKMLSLTAFAQYMLAGVVASSLNIIITPFYNAIYPRFCAYTETDKFPQLLELYKIASRLLATALFSTAMVIAVAGEDVIRLWTGNQGLAHQVAPLATLIAAGTAIHGTMYIPHALQLAQGKTFIPLAINFVLLLVMVPVTASLAFRYGAQGGAGAWLLLHVLYVILATWLMQKYVGSSTGISWFFSDIGVPLLICGAIGAVAKYYLQSLGASSLVKLVLTLMCAAASIAITFAASPSMRLGVIRAVRAEVRR